jgi:hypothetical protein
MTAMERAMRAILAAAAGAALAAAPAPAQDCDEACLRAAADRFLSALVAHDPSMLDYNAYARYTENGQELPFGDALWVTASAAPDRRRIYVPDPATGQIGLIATMEEFGAPSLMAARLKLERGRISEVEVIVNRQSQAASADYAALDPPDPRFAEVLAPASRRPRADLTAAADRYFDAVLSGDAGGAPIAESCTRLENGAPAEAGCRAEIDGGALGYVSAIAPRRFEVVDESRGLVLAIAVRHHDGARTEIALSDGTQLDVPAYARTPSASLRAELLRIEDGAIARIETVAEPMHYGAPTGWRGR